MPKIQTKAQREERYKIIKTAQGNQCLACYIEKGIKRGPPRKKLIIEHADNDETNWSWSNLHLICYSHNKIFEKLSVERKKMLLRSYSDQLEREREREGLPTWKSVLKEMISCDDATPEVRLNRHYEKRWLRRARQILVEQGSELKKELIRRAGQYAGCSKQTSENYLFMSTSDDSVFMETDDDDGNKIIVFRHARPAVTGTSQAAAKQGPTPVNRRSGDTVPITRESKGKDAKA